MTEDEVETEYVNEIFQDTKSDNEDTYDADYQLETTETTSMARYAKMVTLALPRKVSECDDICNTIANCLALSDNQVTAMVTTMMSAVFKAEGDHLNSFFCVILNSPQLRMISICANQ